MLGKGSTEPPYLRAKGVPLKVIAICVVIATSIFAFDLSLPLGVAGGAPYVALVLMGVWFSKYQHIYFLAALGSVLTIIGYFMSPSGGVHWVVLSNRGLALFAIWVTAVLLAKHKKIEDDLHTAHHNLDNLEDLVAERTKELTAKSALVDLLHRVAVAANKSEHAEDAMKTCLEEICAYTGWPIGHVYVRPETSPGKMVPSHLWRIEDEARFANFKKITEEIEFDPGVGLPGRVMESGRRLWIKNVGADPNFPRGKLCAEISTYTGFGFPVLLGGEVVAVLEFFSTSVEEPDGPLLRVVDNIGAQLGLVIERNRTEAEIRKSRDELEMRVKERTKELFKSMEKAEVASRAKSEFMANTSHELRTPLNAIIGFSSTMKEKTFGPLSKKYTEYAADIFYSGQHLLELINDILDVSSIEAGKLELYEENLDVGKIAKASMQLIKSRAEDGNVHLTTEIDKDFPALYADARRMKQIFINILSNAVKFTPPGGRVSLNVSLNGEDAPVFTVTDTGMGMSKKELVKAISEFGQVDSGLARKHEGTGLGLPLTKGLVERHGGTLEIESKKGEGTTVIMYFPKERIVKDAATL